MQHDLSLLHHPAKSSRTAGILVCIVRITAGMCRAAAEPVLDHFAFLQQFVETSINPNLKATLETVDLLTMGSGLHRFLKEQVWHSHQREKCHRLRRVAFREGNDETDYFIDKFFSGRAKRDSEDVRLPMDDFPVNSRKCAQDIFTCCATPGE